MIQIIKIRLLQLKREVETLGPLYVLFFLILGIAGGAILYKFLNGTDHLYVYYGSVLLVFLIHAKRKDKRFIRSISAYPFLIYSAEYFLLSTPLLLLSLFSESRIFLPVILISFIAISTIPYEAPRLSIIFDFSDFIPSGNFEWKAGLRKFFWIIFPLYILAFALVFVKFISLFILWLIMGFISGFYQFAEPLNILQINETGSKKFLAKKIKSHLKIFILLTLPLIILYMLLHPEQAWLPCLVYLVSLINLILFILLKYSYYRPNDDLSPFIMVPVALAQASLLIPFLLPLPLLMCFREYSKAIETIKKHLHD